MKAQFRVYAMAVALLPILAACENHPAAPVEESFFDATIEFMEVVNSEVVRAGQTGFNGPGEFYVGNNPRLDGVMEFTLNAEGRGTSTGQRFLLFRRGAGIPEVGVYPIGTMNMADAGAEGFVAVYSIEGEIVRYFTSASGTLEITYSSPEVVRGSFNFSGFLYCATDMRTGDSFGPCSIPPAPLAGVPTINVHGGFVAHPMDPTAWPMN